MTNIDYTNSHSENDRSVALVFVKSGKLIGMNLYAYERAIEFLTSGDDKSFLRAKQKEYESDKNLMWIDIGAFEIQILKDKQEFKGLQKEMDRVDKEIEKRSEELGRPRSLNDSSR